MLIEEKSDHVKNSCRGVWNEWGWIALFSLYNIYFCSIPAPGR